MSDNIPLVTIITPSYNQSKFIKYNPDSVLNQTYKNIEYILSDIDDMPLEDNSVDVIISNCVINLTPDKRKSFDEAYRILKTGGRMFVSDIVLLEELTHKQRADEDLIAGCVGGALLKENYLGIIKKTGFEIEILHEDTKISKEQYRGINLESIMVKAVK